MAAPLKSVDYEVFGRVQGKACPGGAEAGLWERQGKGVPSFSTAASSSGGTDFRSAVTQQPRVGRRGTARAREGGGREVTQGVRGRRPADRKTPVGQRSLGYCSQRLVGFGFS